MTQPTPFQIRVDDSVLDDLRQRLARCRFPDEIPDNRWRYGPDLTYMKSLVEYWRSGYDWRAHEGALNRFRQYKVRIAGIDLHFIHEEGKGPAPAPLLISHGWPGSVYEFHRILPLLTDPAGHGADARDAFTVVAPSLPGYTFSFAPGQKRFAIEEIAEVFNELMTRVLGYSRYAAQGGDWGAFVTSRLGYAHPESLYGIHLNLLAVRREPKLLENPSAEEKRFLEELNHFLKEETGYQWIQGTKPQTLAYALTDSPLGLAAWLVEKFYTWTDCGGDLDRYFGRDVILTCIMLYWVTGAIGSSFWPYYARMHGPWPIPEGKTVDVPMGYLELPKEILHPPRSVAQRMYSDIRRWTRAEKGGHFAALEQPQLLAQEIRAFFRDLRP
ncbi:MAG TPA: alpha/beta fold hydrolase [Burkholderiales bacterium]|nr:alpha/beta fold hydrolase [Burkholderiales bacterium]